MRLKFISFDWCVSLWGLIYSGAIELGSRIFLCTCNNTLGMLFDLPCMYVTACIFQVPGGIVAPLILYLHDQIFLEHTGLPKFSSSSDKEIFFMWFAIFFLNSNFTTFRFIKFLQSFKIKLNYCVASCMYTDKSIVHNCHHCN